MASASTGLVRRRGRAAVLAGAVLLDVFAAAGCPRREAPAPPPAAAVTGRVLGPDGAAVGGAEVELTADPPDGRVRVAGARSGAAGQFRLDRIPPGRYRVHARLPGAIAAWSHVDVAPPPAPQPPAIELRLSAAV